MAIRTFLERKELAYTLIKQNILNSNEGLEGLEELSSQTQLDIDAAVFKLAQILGNVQSEMLNTTQNVSKVEL